MFIKYYSDTCIKFPTKQLSILKIDLMKKNTLFIIYILFHLVVYGQDNSKDILLKHNINQEAFVEWNTLTGIPYKQVPGANLGATSFEILDSNRIAFLCNSTNEIIITNKVNTNASQRFQVAF